VLISAGIGVTPFASIIKNIHTMMAQSRALKQAGLPVPNCLKLNLQKVYFIWVCRTQESFQWFTDIIARTKQEMGDKFEIHVYLSTVTFIGDVTAGMTLVLTYADVC
jgi:ferredoxin-NADP reductase